MWTIRSESTAKYKANTRSELNNLLKHTITKWSHVYDLCWWNYKHLYDIVSYVYIHVADCAADFEYGAWVLITFTPTLQRASNAGIVSIWWRHHGTLDRKCMASVHLSLSLYFWFNIDALAHGNAYKPTKKPINFFGPGGDRTHDLQTETAPPAASCPARSLHATGIVSWKHNANDMPKAALDNWQPVWNAQGSISTPVRVNFELRPGAGDIHICWFNCDALAQGNAYKPTKEPINYRAPGGDRTHDLQTEATLPAASCPARLLHATEIVS